MGRPNRALEGGLIFHILNRANARATIFDQAGDYATFVRILAAANPAATPPPGGGKGVTDR